MKKILIPFVAAFGLSLGIATGVVVMRAPKAAPPAVAKKVAKTVKPAPAVADTTTASNADSSNGGASVAALSGTDSAASASVADTRTVPAKPMAEADSKSPAAGATPGLSKQSKQPATASAATARLANMPVKTAVPVKPVSDSLIGRRLAQVFSAMQAKDAARVLEQMSDQDVRAILGSLSSKQQAAILGSFPTQRAALILQATLRTASNGGVE